MIVWHESMVITWALVWVEILPDTCVNFTLIYYQWQFFIVNFFPLKVSGTIWY